MKKILVYTTLILACFSSCTLNSTQEATLNNALSTYVNAHNNGAVLSYVGVIYPPAVAYYKDQGDSTFHYKFDLSAESERPLLTDGTILGTKKENQSIHVKYRFAQLHDVFEGDSEYKIHYAITEDDGVNWFFLQEMDYLNDTIMSLEKRLFK